MVLIGTVDPLQGCSEGIGETEEMRERPEEMGMGEVRW
jgi:hypothetical protein